MTLLANTLLVLATLLALPIAVMVAEARAVYGADAMGLFIFPATQVPQWAALIGVVLIVAQRGQLEWLHASRPVQAAVGGTWLALLGVVAVLVGFMAYGPHTDVFKPWAFILAVVMPLVVIVALAVHVNGSASPAPMAWRIGAICLSLVVVWGAFSMWRVELADERESAAVAARVDAEQARWMAEQHRKLAALSPTAPLQEWLPWLNVSQEELRNPALAAVRARPTLERDLAEMLRSNDAPRALRFLWLWMPRPPASLAAPTRDAIAALPVWAERFFATPPRQPPSDAPDGMPAVFPPDEPVDLSDMAQAAIVLADAYRATNLDFVLPIRAFAVTLQRHALPPADLGTDVTYQARAFLDTWLSGRSGSRGN